MRTPGRHVSPALLSLACLAWPQVAPALAQNAPRPGEARYAAAPELVEEILARLDADDLRERDAAQQRLLDDPRFGIELVERLLRERDLSAEQRRRLDAAALHLFRRSPRAGLGVRFEGPPRQQGILVNDVLPDFPAAETLRRGDVIIEVEGRAMDGADTFQRVILSYRPGETMNVVLLRDGERLEQRVRLGSYEQLNTPVRPGDDLLVGAMRERLRRAMGAEPRPAGVVVIGGALPDDAWVADLRPEDLGDESWATRLARHEVTVGGLPRTATDDEDWTCWVRAVDLAERDPVLVQMDVRQLRNREMNLLRLITADRVKLRTGLNIRNVPDADDAQRALGTRMQHEAETAIADNARQLRRVQDELRRRGEQPVDVGRIDTPIGED